ncbi:hypothetical protein N752_30965 [Desulforamulus aquiferis]|nr:hypothetical protein [Desulforamulus aquiferis]RYD01418.1 hypothetical protein N752_30965 [Desulforamulus aquiferis]
MFLIEKIQLMDNTPVVLVKSFWPVFVGKKLSEHDLVRRGTYEVAQQELGIRWKRPTRIFTQLWRDLRKQIS